MIYQKFLTKKNHRLETERLILRPVTKNDAEGFWVMDSDPDVHIFLGNEPLILRSEVDDIIEYILKQYKEFGIGRYAVEIKETGEFAGWCGLKYTTIETFGHINFIDLGYRFQKRFWGKGYATESAREWCRYVFCDLEIPVLYSRAVTENQASLHVLRKCGFRVTGEFESQGEDQFWLELNREEYLKNGMPGHS